MNIHLEFVAADNPTVAFENSIQQAANILDSMFTDNVTINLTVGYGEVDGETLTNGEAAAGPNLTGGATEESYSTVRADLVAGASPGDSTFTFLPTGTSINGQSEVMVFSSQQKLFGQIAANGTNTDGGAGFATDIPSNELVGVALHELTHAMGRAPDNQTGFSSVPDIFDFFNYEGGGTRLFSDSLPSPSASYFSLNDGFTKWADYGINSDPSDFLNSYAVTNSNGTDVASIYTPEDAFNQYYDSNTAQYLTPMDLEQMDALGFHLKQDTPAANPYDFNGENSGDILLQNGSGQFSYIDMAGGINQGQMQVVTVPGWTAVSEGKISGGVDSDIVIQNGGQVDYIDMVNGMLSHYVAVTDLPGWRVAGVGDINDDHYDDVVFQNATSDQIVYANMDNGVFNGWVSATDPVGWSVKAVADINYDGYDDIVIQSRSSGQIVYENMDNGVFNNFVNVGTLAGYNVVGAGDVTRSGWANVVVQNASNGNIEFANMNNGVFNGWVNVASPFGWNVIGVEDVLGTGYDDIVIQDGAGDIDYANMTGGTFQGWVGIGTTPGQTGLTVPADVSNAGSSTATNTAPSNTGGITGYNGQSGGATTNATAPAPGSSWLTDGTQPGATSADSTQASNVGANSNPTLVGSTQTLYSALHVNT
jgi:hypothetical protein